MVRDFVFDLAIFKEKPLRYKVKEAVDVHTYFGGRK
jgi:hypothetical protein